VQGGAEERLGGRLHAGGREHGWLRSNFIFSVKLSGPLDGATVVSIEKTFRTVSGPKPKPNKVVFLVSDRLPM
jgi:hypothetical protein